MTTTLTSPLVLFLSHSQAPSGFIARGKYTAKMMLVDDDGNLLSEIRYSFEIAKSW